MFAVRGCLIGYDRGLEEPFPVRVMSCIWSACFCPYAGHTREGTGRRWNSTPSALSHFIYRSLVLPFDVTRLQYFLRSVSATCSPLLCSSAISSRSAVSDMHALFVKQIARFGQTML
ncbi:hypothetical protein AcW1_003190 [Taiwanofungus camphoratus]|nr:hypothetical protein AcV7_005892 [Antrodia cinnamomea]KAI0942607.1 hypothetical protein AcW1_003190 [Antrodia cinnamomea]